VTVITRTRTMRRREEIEIVPIVNFMCYRYYACKERQILPVPNRSSQYFLQRGLIECIKDYEKDDELKSKVSDFLGVSLMKNDSEEEEERIYIIEEEQGHDIKVQIIPPWSSYVHGAMICPPQERRNKSHNLWTFQVGDVVAVCTPPQNIQRINGIHIGVHGVYVPSKAFINLHNV